MFMIISFPYYIMLFDPLSQTIGLWRTNDTYFILWNFSPELKLTIWRKNAHKENELINENLTLSDSSF